MNISPYYEKFQQIENIYWSDVLCKLDALKAEIAADEDEIEHSYRVLGQSDDPFVAEQAEDDYDAFQADLAAIADLADQAAAFHALFEDFKFKFPVRNNKRYNHVNDRGRN